MTVFAVESSSRAAGAAIVRDGIIIAESMCDVGLTHSETLMPICKEVFSRAGLSAADIDCFAVTVGPGSFTGLRIGIGTVKGMAFEKRTPCAAVSSLEALSLNCASSQRAVVPVTDARNGRFYTSAFKIDCLPKRLLDDSAATMEQIKETLLKISLPVIFVGDSALLCYNELKNELDCEAAPGYLGVPFARNAALIGEAMCKRGETVSDSALAPVYLQLSQAQRELMKKSGKEDK